uniref:Uncharacterized protein n=1 Tax=Entomoneis paludosa TaxID=265537 RepID=A0A7S2YTR2_9STRA|mmetsp:Transcript_9518/g.19782  ORF Transcript_9518/g.19782 Transcript_9518/m.19782 type:complete len:394 (+) Transcript_9518:81-1262(+)
MITLPPPPSSPHKKKVVSGLPTRKKSSGSRSRSISLFSNKSGGEDPTDESTVSESVEDLFATAPQQSLQAPAGENMPTLLKPTRRKSRHETGRAARPGSLRRGGAGPRPQLGKSQSERQLMNRGNSLTLPVDGDHDPDNTTERDDDGDELRSVTSLTSSPRQRQRNGRAPSRSFVRHKSRDNSGLEDYVEMQTQLQQQEMDHVDEMAFYDPAMQQEHAAFMNSPAAALSNKSKNKSLKKSSSSGQLKKSGSSGQLKKSSSSSQLSRSNSQTDLSIIDQDHEKHAKSKKKKSSKASKSSSKEEEDDTSTTISSKKSSQKKKKKKDKKSSSKMKRRGSGASLLSRQGSNRSLGSTQALAVVASCYTMGNSSNPNLAAADNGDNEWAQFESLEPSP